MTKLINGWVKQEKDKRDFKFNISQKLVLQKTFSLLNLMPAIYDQGNLGSCVGNGVTALLEYHLMLKGKDFLPSRLFAYYNARIDKLNDTGATIRDGVKAVFNFGIFHESIWQYDITKFAEQPSKISYEDAKLYKALKYESVLQDEYSIKAAISLGKPVVFGMLLKQSFENQETAQTGIYKPKGQIIGGHCMVIIGYDDDKKYFTVRNSWGENWGDKGYCYIPYKEIINKKIASDFCVIDSII